MSWAEVCFEIWADGPKAELDYAVPAEPRDSCLAELQVLRLTDFSRRCARLWLAKHGRRFSCYKERKDKGGKTLHRYTGSLAAVQAGQRKAFDALTAMRAADVAASRETRIAFGKQWSRTAIVDAAEARASSAEAGKKMRDFMERTSQIVDKKRSCRPWSGVGGQLPAVRRRTGTTTNSVRPSWAHRIRTPSVPHRKTIPLIQKMRCGTPFYGRKPIKDFRKASRFSVHSVGDLDMASGDALDDNVLAAWAYMIGTGAQIRERQSVEVIQLRPAAGGNLCFTERFRSKHRRLSQFLSTCSPKWKNPKLAADGIDSLRDVVGPA